MAASSPGARPTACGRACGPAFPPVAGAAPKRLAEARTRSNIRKIGNDKSRVSTVSGDCRCGRWSRLMPACRRPRSGGVGRAGPASTEDLQLATHRPRKLSDAELGELADLVAETDPRDHGFAVAL